MLKPYLQLLMERPHLTRIEAQSAMRVILNDPDPHQIAAFLAVLKYRKESADEVIGITNALQESSVQVTFKTPVLDIVGTGGDLSNTVNISTGSAILAAACGIPIAKHGNRASSSRSGSADVLEALGVDIETTPDELPYYLEKVGMVFMYAPTYHPSLKKLAPIRKALNLPTVLNMIGPLLNPARAEFSLIGVANESHLEVLSQVIPQLIGKGRTLLFHGMGLDELTPMGKMIAYDIQEDKVERLEIDPVSLGYPICSLKDLQGGDATMNASILIDVLAGKEGAVADALTFNAGAAVWVFRREKYLFLLVLEFLIDRQPSPPLVKGMALSLVPLLFS